jgi:uncharacterized protein YkwD
MATLRRWKISIPALLLASLLAACGGGSDGGSGGGATQLTQASVLAQEPGAPVMTGNPAIDGINWINYRRTQAGLTALTQNSRIDVAAQAHSDYQRMNNTMPSHEQTPGLPGFTGATVPDRLNAAGYTLIRPFAYGEVIAAAGDPAGAVMVEELIGAIYHRFVILEPRFKDIGAGSATTGAGYTYFTADFGASNGYGAGLGRGKIITYPFAAQTKVPPNFFSDTETPDPVPNQNEVGYPISVHADITSKLSVQSFSVHPRGGADLAVRLLSAATDTETGIGTAAIIPLAVLAAGTIYDVSFTGIINYLSDTGAVVDSVAVSRDWSFTTR